MRLRMFVSIVLFFLWLITGITGTILLLGRLFPSLPVEVSDTLHIYLGFAFFGLSVVHIYLNWAALKSYFRKLL
ncbi:hypothetical protein A3L04_07985 [Thermococcus chitonophagus]|uniref:Flavinylation-associated cytochrome domain-containing protein n=1 Tax=Thermococcus chitonophagus TaxID=54262 RepID=A0A160VRY8_9EURY|nr:DUF4405 domain-containing protein [Thermococcus chitonophagus]ASJ17013.1 hypothetical protein A3L04_07985 [Thermococcus chitonophagus]CUX77602.1 hypothetical protein CHITON_0823 [Thermococcus chitonophagus]